MGVAGRPRTSLQTHTYILIFLVRVKLLGPLAGGVTPAELVIRFVGTFSFDKSAYLPK